MASYSPTDLIMLSPEVYRVILSDYGDKFVIINLVILATQIKFFSSLFQQLDSLDHRNFKILVGSHVLEWGLLAGIFYRTSFAEITWYWPWLFGLCCMQIFILSVILLRGASFKNLTRKNLFQRLVLYLFLTTITILIFPEFAIPLLIYAPIQLVFKSLLIVTLIKPRMASLALILLPPFLFVHELLIMWGR